MLLKNQNESEKLESKAWPISGGVHEQKSDQKSELIISGHEDGQVRFWQVSMTRMNSLLRIQTSKVFDKRSLLLMGKGTVSYFLS